MSMRYKGAVLSATAPTTSSSSAQGIWTMRQQLQAVGGTGWPVPPPTTIGQAYGGGYYAGKISTAGTGVADYYLIVAPKASGNALKAWGVYGTTTGVNSVINGPTNTSTLAALGASYEAALFCKNLTIGGYTDWYLPAKNELEVLYYFLKPTTTANNTSSGSNANAVSPEPFNTNYTSGSPAQTSVAIFQSPSGSEFLSADNTYSSTEGSLAAQCAWNQQMNTGQQLGNGGGKGNAMWTRAVRRVPV